MTTTPAVIYSLAPCEVQLNGGSLEVLPVESFGFTADILQTVHHHSGNISATLVAVPGANPRVSLSIPFLKAYEVFGLNEVRLDVLNLYLAKFADFARSSGSVHAKLALTAGCVAAAQITGWSVNVDGILMATVDIVPLAANSRDNPLTLTTTEALPTITGTPTLHTLGPVEIDGDVVAGFTSAEAAVNGNLLVNRHDGDRYPRVAARTMVSPTFTLGHANPVGVLAALGLTGDSIASEVGIYYKRYDPVTGLTDAEDSAIKVSIARGRVHPTGGASTQGAVANTGITIIPIAQSNGLLMPFGITTSVIPPDAP